jgi:hypothetical protein
MSEGFHVNLSFSGFVVFKGIGSFLFLKYDLEKICRENYKNHLRSNNYEVCTAVARFRHYGP